MQNITRVAPCAKTLISHSLRRNIGVTSVAMAKTNAPTDSVQKLYIDKIREYAKLSAAGKIQMDAQSQKDFEAESAKLKKLYGGGDLTKFPEFQFKEIDFEAKKDA
ncbi:ATP synthase-coupling factor 6, mitochondrial-like [Apostichopus japonicus]|uniref:ATP synthase-coupling factor 6, mitochondrial-like n=1 Tax=Stichopus japonicus TaxID=307972 RepID=UPI003AB679EF